MTKLCKKCGEEKDKNKFSKDKKRKDGLQPHCKDCYSRYRKINRESIIVQKKYYYDINKKRLSQQRKQKYVENIFKLRKQKNDCYRKNQLSRQKKIEYQKIYGREYERRTEVKERRRKCQKERLKNDFKFVLRRRISSMLRSQLRSNKKQKTMEMLDFDLPQLKRHLEKQFTEGMTWENIGQWHIDHIIPISVFNFSLPEHLDFKRCWALSNLRPLWAKENLSKGAKLDNPFQPSLRL